MSQKTLISGHYRDASGRTYHLSFEPAIALSDGSYIIQREHSITVWRIEN